MVGRFLAGDESDVKRGVDVQESEYQLLELGQRLKEAFKASCIFIKLCFGAVGKSIKAATSWAIK
jgi:hypothetical protein